MEYNRIIAITGLGGLYEMLSSKTDGAIVRSLEDQQTRFVSSRIHNFSHLESIEVYTVRENINLVDLFKAIKDSGEALPSEKDAGAVKAFFEKVYPDMDFGRIYNSDMKKMVKWYNLLSTNQIEFKLSEPSEDDEELEEVEAIEEAPAAEPAKKAAKKVATPEATAPEAAHTAEEAPAKKKAVKKAAESEDAAEPAPKKAAKPAAKKATEDEEAPAKKKAAPKKK